MIYLFDKCHYSPKSKIIKIQAPIPRFDSYDVPVAVKSKATGAVKMFKVDKEATTEYGMACEFWDGEESHVILSCIDNPEVSLEIWNTPYDPIECFEGDTFIDDPEIEAAELKVAYMEDCVANSEYRTF